MKVFQVHHYNSEMFNSDYFLRRLVFFRVSSFAFDFDGVTESKLFAAEYASED